MSGAWPWLAGPLAAACIALVVVRLAIVYAHRRGILDLPGQRRSHQVPTPRGGGIGIVLACLVTMPAAAMLVGGIAPGVLAAFDTGLLLVAGIGWWDDHRPLGAAVRLLVQFVAVALLGGVVCWHAPGWLPLVVLGGVASVNLHNFMDGIDALLAMHGIVVGVALALMAAVLGQGALALMAACLATACAGFGWYNRSPAKIFMGDVGSGSVGFLIYALVLLLWRGHAQAFWPAIIVCSSFVADASLTLLCRIMHGRRWYAAHREHLYQWLVRRGFSHRRVVAWYAGWNLLATLVAVWAFCLPRRGFLIAIPFYLVASGCWILAKRRCLTLAKSCHVHA